jgi:hypothetical protein
MQENSIHWSIFSVRFWFQVNAWPGPSQNHKKNHPFVLRQKRWFDRMKQVFWQSGSTESIAES